MAVIDLDFGQFRHEQLEPESTIRANRHPVQAAGPAVDFAHNTYGRVDSPVSPEIVTLGVRDCG